MALDLKTQQVPCISTSIGTRIAHHVIQPIQPPTGRIPMTIPAPSPPRPDLPPDVTPKLPLPPDINPDMPHTPLNDPVPPLAPPSIIAEGTR